MIQAHTGRAEVFGGHWVPVKPTPLPRPVLVAHSREVAEMLGLSEADCASEASARRDASCV